MQITPAIAFDKQQPATKARRTNQLPTWLLAKECHGRLGKSLRRWLHKLPRRQIEGHSARGKRMFKGFNDLAEPHSDARAAIRALGWHIHE